MITRPHKSRIFYNKKLFDYPLRALDALTKLGFFESFLGDKNLLLRENL